MSKTVMIVEDNELNMKLFHDLLEAYGYPTIGTRNGFEVLDLARKRRPDLILMDIQLPEVSGLEVTKWLKEDPELQAIPVVAVTAFAMGGDEERIREGGCQAYLSKPISVPKFIETIRRFLGVGQSMPAISRSRQGKAATPPKVNIAVARRIRRSPRRECSPPNIVHSHNLSRLRASGNTQPFTGEGAGSACPTRSRAANTAPARPNPP
jgi:two-component system cell cycle response regulator DivK